MSRTALIDRSPAANPAPRTTLTVFCDFDGPIVDVSDRYYTTYQLGLADTQEHFGGLTIVASRNGIAPLSKAQFWQMKQNRVPDVEIAEQSGLQGEQISWFMQRVCQIVNQPALLHLDRLQPGVRWGLELLHSQGVKLVLVTLRERQQAMQFLHEHDLLHLFDRVWGATDDRAAYQNCADHKTQLLSEAIALHPSSSAWMIGDTEADVLAGQAAGVPTIALTCGIRSHHYLHQFNPDLIHSDLVSAVNSILYSNWRRQNFA